MKPKLQLLGGGDVCKLLNISAQRLDVLVVKYKIPHYKTSAGRIYLKKDIVDFQKQREQRLRTKKK